MVERRDGPAYRRLVASVAFSRRKGGTCRRVHRIIGLLPGRQMASGISAIGRSGRQIVIVVDVARGAGHIRMAIGQQESGRAVVELGVQPRVKRMAGLAGGGELCGNVVGISCLLKIRQVAGRACRRETQVIADGRVLMALVALQDGMRTEQWKSIEVLLNRLDRYLPAEDGMALGAVLAKLSAVNVGVTIGAILANVRENRLGVTPRAGHFFVHAAKRIPRGVMIEFGNGANGSPACVRVAIFAGNVEGTVRTPARLSLGDCGHDHG